jgi:hypothetical protein
VGLVPRRASVSATRPGGRFRWVRFPGFPSGFVVWLDCDVASVGLGALGGVAWVFCGFGGQGGCSSGHDVWCGDWRVFLSLSLEVVVLVASGGNPRRVLKSGHNGWPLSR